MRTITSDEADISVSHVEGVLPRCRGIINYGRLHGVHSLSWPSFGFYLHALNIAASGSGSASRRLLPTSINFTRVLLQLFAVGEGNHVVGPAVPDHCALLHRPGRSPAPPRRALQDELGGRVTAPLTVTTVRGCRP